MVHLRFSSLMARSSVIAAAAVVAWATVDATARAQSQPSAGQQVAQAAPASVGNTGELEEIVVTARRREENLQSVPITIQAISAADLATNNIQTGSDLTHLVPALVSNQISRDEQVFSIRGQGPGPVGNGAYPGVQVYFNEVPVTAAPAKTLGPGGGAGPGVYYDLDSVQVLEGPQGTLFGRNSTGGAILFTSKKPDNDYEGYVQTQFGNYGDKEVQGAINIPIVEDKVLLRISGSRATRDGFTEQLGTGKDLDNRDYWAGRVALTIRPTDEIENTTIVDDFYSHTNGGSVIYDFYQPISQGGSLDLFYNLPSTVSFGTVTGCAPTLLNPLNGCSLVPGILSGKFIAGTVAHLESLGVPAGTALAEAQGYALGIAASTTLGKSLSGYPTGTLSRQLALQQALGIRQTVGGLNGLAAGPLDRTENYGVSNTTTWNVTDDLTIKNIFGFRQLKNLTRTDETGIGLPVLGIIPPNDLTFDVHQFTDEVQVQGKSFDEKLNWILGGFWYYNSNGGTTLQDSYYSLPGSLMSTLFVPTGLVSYINNNQDHSVAAFGQATYDFSDVSPTLNGLKFTAGYRYTWDFRSASYASFNLNDAGAATSCTSNLTPAGQLPPSAANGQCELAKDGAFHAGEFNLSLDYQATPDLLYYLTSRRGYKSGGFNAQVEGYDPAIVEYRPEYLTDVEIGAKTEMMVFGMKTRANIDFYHDWYENPQFQQLIEPVAGDYLEPTVNSGSGSVDGVELNATVLPTKATEVTFNYAYAYGVLSSVPISAIAITGNSAFAHNVPMGQLPQNKFSLTGKYHLPIPDTMGDLAFTANWNYNSHYYSAAQNADNEPGDRVDGYGLVNLSLDWNDVGGRPVDVSLYGTNVLNRSFVAGDYVVYKLIGYDARIYNEPAMYGVKLKLRWGPGVPSLFDKS